MGDIETICQGLAQAVQAMLNPMSPQPVRMDAYTHCESFKEQSPPGLSIQCGLVLCLPKYPDVVRHFGLKLLEETIKLKWNDMPTDQKVFVKENAMRLMESGVVDIVTEGVHIKDGISRIVVEMVKREWPQNWPNLLAELESLCAKGDAQTELVMLVMLRIVEDVAVLQTLEQNQRRKEIYQGLVSEMTTIFCFLLSLLERHYQAYQSSSTEDVRLRHSKVCESVLATFNAFVEWVPMSNIMANDYYLVKCLCHLLNDDKMQLQAAECLLTIVGSKVGKLPERAQVLVLFKRETMAALFQAVEKAESRPHDEQHYAFLKRMVQILVELGGQVCAVWSSNTPCDSKMPPENFDVYLNALLAFTRHDSMMVNYFANELWAKLLRQNDLARDEQFRSYIQKWVEVALKKTIKQGHPSKSDHPSCSYAKLDFDSDEEFVAFFGKYRIIVFDVIKLIRSIDPMIPYHFTDTWLRSVLSSPPNFGRGKNVCSVTSPIYLELEAIQIVLDAIMVKISKDELQPLLLPAVNLLKTCLEFITSDPCLMSVVLSCISSLFIVVTVTPAALMPTLNRIIESIKFESRPAIQNDPLTNFSSGLSSEAKFLRRHGCCLLVKIGYRYPETLAPVFEYLRSTIIDGFHAGLLHKTEYVTLIEALILVSNEFSNFAIQSSFIKSISEPVIRDLRSILPILSNTEQFMQFIGIIGSNDPEILNCQRSQIAFSMQFLLAISRRAACPLPDLTKCRQGGFVYNGAGLEGYNNLLALKNPGAEVGCVALEIVLTYAKTLNDLWSPSSLEKMNPETKKLLDMMEAEKNAILGVSGNQRLGSVGPNEEIENNENTEDPSSKFESGSNGQKSELQRLQCFIFEQYENVYHFLSQCCVTFGHDFYKQPNIAEAISSTMFVGFHHIPDYRLRSIIRTFLKNLINKCPHRYFLVVVAPLLNQLLPYMLQRLKGKWNKVISVREAPNYDEDNADSQEVLEEITCRHLTREYIDVLKAALTSGGGSDLKYDDAKVYASTENLSKSAGEAPGSHSSTLSELGRLLLQNDGLFNQFLATLLDMLLWPDSPASSRAAVLLEAMLPLLSARENLSSEQAYQIIFTMLHALHVMGQHEMNFIVLVQVSVLAYELLRPRHPRIVDVLALIPGCSPEDLKRFDNHVLLVIKGKENGGKPPAKVVGDRTLKHMFRKLIGQLIGKDVAKMFKQNVVIKNLPTLITKPRHKTPNLDDCESHELGITSLFGQNGTSSAIAPTIPSTASAQPFTL